MNNEIKKYDLVCSLGGNCTAAHNLLFRNMRKYSLPFDWCYVKDDKFLDYLCEGFKNNFKDFLLKENLVELTGDEYNIAHQTREQYNDLRTGYYFVNHFPKGISLDKSYTKVYAKMRRRLDRLQYYIKNGQSILFILSVTNKIDYNKVIKLSQTLKELYPAKNIEFIIMSFGEAEDKEYMLDDNISIKNYTRNTNLYDFIKTNYEWSFLDNIKIIPQKNLLNKLGIRFSYFNKKLSVYIFERINTVFRANLYILGLKLDFCIGKVREK